MDDVVWNIAETAKQLKISKSLCYQMCNTGQLPCYKAGKRTLVPVAALLERLNSQTQAES